LRILGETAVESTAAKGDNGYRQYQIKIGENFKGRVSSFFK
jgi:hypothetical protein